MKQIRFHAVTNQATANALMLPLDLAFAEEGYPVAIHENPDNEAEWTMSVYVPSGEMDEVQARLGRIMSEAGVDLAFGQEELPEVDWVAQTLRELSPVRAGRFVVHGSHDRGVAKPHEIAVEIDAGLAFGTGHHGTTAGCLDMFDKVSKARQFANVLDLGTGSGVLAIAIAKQSRKSVLASDIDPVASETARANAMRNCVHPLMRCETARGLNHREIVARAPYDLVVANILAKPLQSMAREIGLVTTRQGMVILSGLLPHQRAPVLARFRQHGMRLKHDHVRDGWLTLVLEKP